MELTKKITSVRLCMEAHPDNEPDSEFADRISDLEEIESELTQLKAENERMKAEMVLFEAMKDYARIQIENRTNQIIDIITDYESPMPNEFIIKRIQNLPITLD